MSINKVFLIGRMGADAESRSTTTGKTVATFNIAVDQGFGEQKTTEWVSCEVWNKAAEATVRMVGKGNRVAVVGRLKTDKWQTDSGETKYKTKVVVDDIDFIDFRDSNKPEDQSQEVADPDIPF